MKSVVHSISSGMLKGFHACKHVEDRCYEILLVAQKREVEVSYPIVCALVFAFKGVGYERKRLECKPVTLATIAAVLQQQPNVFPRGSVIGRLPHVRDKYFHFMFVVLTQSIALRRPDQPPSKMGCATLGVQDYFLLSEYRADLVKWSSRAFATPVRAGTARVE